MNLHLTGHHLEITPAIREYVSGKLQRHIEASVHVRGKEIFCESADTDMYAAIDGLMDKLDRTIIKHKEKSLGHRHDGTARRHQSSE